MEQPAENILPLILRSLAERELVCELVLAVYRVELTSTLGRIAEGAGELGDLERVDLLAAQIAATAGAASRLGAIQTEALALRRRTEEAQSGTERAEGAMLVAGLRLIDRILGSARYAARPPREPASLN